MAVGCRSNHVRYGAGHFPAALLVGRRSRFDRRVVKPALLTCGSTFWRFFLEGASAASPSFIRGLRHGNAGLGLRDACGECWGSSGGLLVREVGPAGGRRRGRRYRGRGRGCGRLRLRRFEFSWVAPDVPGGCRSSSSAALGERSGEGWCSLPVL
jgi:hypothetical protein